MYTSYVENFSLAILLNMGEGGGKRKEIGGKLEKSKTVRGKLERRQRNFAKFFGKIKILGFKEKFTIYVMLCIYAVLKFYQLLPTIKWKR